MESLEKIEHDVLTNNLIIYFVYQLCDLLTIRFHSRADAIYHKHKTLDYLTKILHQYKNSHYNSFKYSVYKLKECLNRSIIFKIKDRKETDEIDDLNTKHVFIYSLANMVQLTYVQEKYNSSIFHHIRQFNFKFVIKILAGKIKKEYENDTTRFYDANNFETLEYENELMNGKDVGNFLEPSVLNRKPDLEYFKLWTKHDNIHKLSLNGTIKNINDLIYCINENDKLKLFVLSLYMHCKVIGFDLNYMFIHYVLNRNETLTRIILSLYNSMLLTDGCWRIYKSNDKLLKYCKLKNASCGYSGEFLDNDFLDENNRNYCKDNNFKRNDLINSDNSDDINLRTEENNYCNSIYCNINIKNYTEIDDLYECFTSCIPTIYNMVLNTVPNFLEDISSVKNAILQNNVDINYITFEIKDRESFSFIEIYYNGMYINENEDNCILFYPLNNRPPLDENLDLKSTSEINKSYLNRRGINANDYIIDDINSNNVIEPESTNGESNNVIKSESTIGVSNNVIKSELTIGDSNNKFNILNYLNNNYIHLFYAFGITLVMFVILTIFNSKLKYNHARLRRYSNDL